MWEDFQKGGYSSLGGYISITKASIYISSGIVGQIGKFDYVKLCFDKDESMVGILPMESNQKYSYKTTYNPMGNGCRIGSAAHVNHFKIKYGRYIACIDDGMIIAKVEISEEG